MEGKPECSSYSRLSRTSTTAERTVMSSFVVVVAVVETRIKSRRWWLNSLERFVTVTSATSRSSARTRRQIVERCVFARGGARAEGRERGTPGLRDDKDRSRLSCSTSTHVHVRIYNVYARAMCAEKIFSRPDSLCSTTTGHNRKSRGVIFDAFRCNCQLPTVYGSASGTRECARNSQRRSDNAGNPTTNINSATTIRIVRCSILISKFKGGMYINKSRCARALKSAW